MYYWVARLKLSLKNGSYWIVKGGGIVITRAAPFNEVVRFNACRSCVRHVKSDECVQYGYGGAGTEHACSGTSCGSLTLEVGKSPTATRW